MRVLPFATFILTVFVSAFLLFQVQPITARHILPWFGGTPSVWTTCMLFFQIFLFLGYAYAFALQRWFRPLQQTLIHAALLILALALLPIAPSESWQGTSALPPVLVIITILATSVGIPYFLLSSTGPLLQVWFAHVNPDRSPYPLYAVSNAGSFLALLSYPFLIEPVFALSKQVQFWSGSFVLFVVLCALVAGQLVLKRRPSGESATEELPETPAPTWKTRAFWIGLPALASISLLSITNLMTQDISAVPLLWVVPLSIYLLTFILCFESQRWYRPIPLRWALLVILLAQALIFVLTKNSLPLMSIATNCALLFVTCMICHGALEKRKPAPDHLTQFYLMIAAGGALGGISIGVLAPLIFNSHTEVLLCQIIFMALIIFPTEKQEKTPLSLSARPRKIAIGFLYFLFVAALASDVMFGLSSQMRHSRNFYGVLVKSTPEPKDASSFRYLRHGRILHGAQFLQVDRQMIPTTYYGVDSGLGRTLDLTKPTDEIDERKIGAVGLGAGTAAAYGTEKDVIRFYEINPEVIEIAEQDFTFLSRSKAEVDLVLGDALISLREEAPQAFDLLVLDAFSGDAIPVHLLTREAFEVYQKHMKSGGVIAIHISNQYLDLRPVLWALADNLGMSSVTILSGAVEEDYVNPAVWVIMSENTEIIDALSGTGGVLPRDPAKAPILWTEDYSNIFRLIGSIDPSAASTGDTAQD